jgi:hypothetical protein
VATTTPQDPAAGLPRPGRSGYLAWVLLIILFGVASATAITAPIKLGFVGAMAALAIVRTVIPVAPRTYSLRGPDLKNILNAFLDFAWVPVYFLFYGGASLRWLTLVHGIAVVVLADAAAELLVPRIRRRAV